MSREGLHKNESEKFLIQTPLGPRSAADAAEFFKVGVIQELFGLDDYIAILRELYNKSPGDYQALARWVQSVTKAHPWRSELQRVGKQLRTEHEPRGTNISSSLSGGPSTQQRRVGKSGGKDVYDSGKILPGSFEGGKRR